MAQGARVRLDGAAEHLPVILARLHWATQVGAAVVFEVDGADTEKLVAGRQPPATPDETLADVLVGAGYEAEEVAWNGRWLTAMGRRARSLPDTVRPAMGLLVCGLNPSEYAADRGVGYARPGNRFWPAALAAGLVSRDRDPLHALEEHGVGMTDLVKRATPRASALHRQEYRTGTERVRRLVRWLEPGVVCFVGMQGWRAAVDSSARPGVQPEPFGGRPAYVMPSTSGLNAHASLAELTAHLRAARLLAA